MLSYQEAFYQLKKELQEIYEEREAVSVAHELLEHITGAGRMQRILDKEKLLSAEQYESFQRGLGRLLRGEPLQYVTGVQWFLGRPYNVNPDVLIPRPETEELVQWIIDDCDGREKVAILDIGSGSGCIPITLKLSLPRAEVSSIDISTGALRTAKQNAANLGAEVAFMHVDFLEQRSWAAFSHYDVIVSNPPYIPLSEKQKLDRNVREFEPGTALFVPDDDALVFYRHLALFGKEHLQPAGAIYCEVHQDYALATKSLLDERYSDVSLRKDVHGNDRMIRASEHGRARK